MIKIDRLRNMLTYSDISSADLDALLADTAYKGALHALAVSGWIQKDCLRLPAAREILLESSKALDILFGNLAFKLALYASQEVFDYLTANATVVDYMKRVAIPVSFRREEGIASFLPIYTGRMVIVEAWTTYSSATYIRIINDTANFAPGASPIVNYDHGHSENIEYEQFPLEPDGVKLTILRTAANASFYTYYASNLLTGFCTYIKLDAES